MSEYEIANEVTDSIVSEWSLSSVKTFFQIRHYIINTFFCIVCNSLEIL